MATDINLGVIVKLTDRLTGPFRDVEKEVSAAAQKLEKRLAFSAKLTGAGAAAGILAEGTRRLVTGFVDNIREVEKAKGELATLGVENLDAVVAKARKTQGELAGVTAGAFVRAAYDIKSGISSLSDEGVADMTAAAMLVAKATKGVPEEMTSLFATGYGIFKKQYAAMGDADFGNLFGAMLSKSVQVFKTKGSEMHAAIEAAGAAATNYGMKMYEQMAVLGQLQTVMSGAEAGTALKAFAAQSAAAHEKFGAMAITASHPVRVRILDDNNMLRAMPDILADLKARYGETLDAIEGAEIKEAFGSDEAVKIIQALYGQEAAVRANAEALRLAGAEGEKFTRSMAGAADNNMDSKLTLAAQKWDLIQQKIASALLPALDMLLPKIESIVNAVGGWIDRNPKLATALGTVVILVGALAAITAAVLIPLGFMSTGYAIAAAGATALKLSVMSLSLAHIRGTVQMVAYNAAGMAMAGLKLAGTAIMTLAGSVRALGMAMLSNPIFLAIAAIAAAAYLIYANWDKLKPYFLALWEGVKAVFSAVFTFLKAIVMTFTPVGLIYKHWDSISAWFAALWEGVKGAFSAAIDWLVPLFLNFTPAGLIYKHWDTISAWFAALWEGVKGAFSAAIDWLVPLFLNFTPAGLIYKHWDAISAWFSGLWEGVKSAFSTFWGWVKQGAEGDFNPANLIIAHWQSISAWFSGLWASIKAVFSDAWSSLTGFAQRSLDGYKTLWSGLSSWFSGLWARVSGVFSSAWANIRALVSGWAGNMAAMGRTLIERLAAGIRAAPGAVWNALQSAVFGGLNRVRSMLGLHATPTAASPAVSLAGKRAKGGPVLPRSLYLVGEEGQELFMPDQPGTIIPNGLTERLLRPASFAAAGAAAFASPAYASAGNQQGRALHFAPNYNVSVNLAGGRSGGTSADVEAAIRRALAAHEAEQRADLARLLHD